ncbi:MAG: hypothetical protein KatS3mg087_1632 [Patescibacteria group bacterium]|nr:MAG: hypothetical protein KatS3mg087_1632 [Patescibacteria group bacterium]
MAKMVRNKKRAVLHKRLPSFVIPAWVFSLNYTIHEQAVLCAVYRWHAPPEKTALSIKMISQLSQVSLSKTSEILARFVEQGIIEKREKDGITMYSPVPELVYQPIDDDYYQVGGDLGAYKMIEQSIYQTPNLGALMDSPSGKKIKKYIRKILEIMPVNELKQNAVAEGVWDKMVELAQLELKNIKGRIHPSQYKKLEENVACNKYRMLKLGEYL